MDSRITEITSLQQPGIEIFGTLTESQLRNKLNAEKGLFIAESPKVIRVALQAGYVPTALLCERRHITGDAADIIAACGDIPIYTGSRELLAQLTGYTLTRGVLCAMRRKPEPAIEDVLNGASRVCVIDAVCDTTNIGAIFRSAAALGIDAVLLTRSSCAQGHTRINGNGIPCTLDVARFLRTTEGAWIPYGSNGSYRQVHLARRSYFETAAQTVVYHGDRG